MAISPFDEYPGQVSAPDADYPYGGPKNATAPGAFDGTPLEAKIMGDFMGFIQALLNHASLVPTGVPERVTASQVLDAIIFISKEFGFSTGDAKITLKSVADAGWIMANDGTIGSASSGATTRANADCRPLYNILWNNVSDTYAPVSTGRGGSADEDFDANKTIGLTKQLGRALAIAGTGSGLTARTLGQIVGAETHQLTIAELAAHAHVGLAGDGTRFNRDTSAALTGSGQTFYDHSGSNFESTTGSDAAHNNMQPSAFWNIMIKL